VFLLLSALPHSSDFRLPATPKGLASGDWASSRCEYERHRHIVVPEKDGYRAPNYGQQWLTDFYGRGFTVQPDSGG